MAETRVVILADANQAVQEFDRLRNSATNSLGQIGTAGQSLNRTTVSAAQTAAALRQVPAQFTDIVVSLQAGQAPLTVLLQQGGQLRDMFGSTGAAARALGGYVVSLINPYTVLAASAAAIAYAYHEGSKEAAAYNSAIITSGNVAGVTSHQLADMAREVGASVGSQSAASKVLATMAGSGAVAAENMQQFAKVSLEVARTGARSAEEMAQDFNKLGKAPLDASRKLTEQYHYLTAAGLAQIKMLEDQGRQEEAAAVAQQAYASAWSKRAGEMQEKLGLVERAWAGAGQKASWAWDKFLGVGREETPKQIEEKAAARIAYLQSQLPIAKMGGNSREGSASDIQAEIDAQQKVLDRAREKNSLEKEAAKAAAESVRLEEAKTKWQDAGVKYLTKEEQLRTELTRQTQLGRDAGMSPDLINARLALVRKSYGELNNAALAALEGQRALDQEVLAGRMANLESRHRQELVSETQFIAEKRDLQLKDLASEAAVVQKQADLAAGRSDLSERNKYLAALAVLQQRRKNIIQQAEDSIADVEAAGTKAVRNQATAWAAASQTEQEQLVADVALFDQSAEARAISSAQIKVDAEARQLVANWVKQGHVFSEQERADLLAAASARKANIATIMGEQQARAGAEQLRQENERMAVESIADEDVRAATQLQREAKVWRERIALASDGSDAQKALQEQFDTWYEKRQLAPVVGRWNTIIGSLDNNFQEGFRDMLTNGESPWKAFSKSIGNTLKTTLADTLYQVFVKKYVVQAVVNLAGAVSGSSVASALTGNATSAANAAGGASSALSTVGLAASIGNGVANAGTWLGSSTVAEFGSGLSGSAAAAAEALGAEMTTAASAGSALASAFATAVPWVAAAAIAYKAWTSWFEDGVETNTRLQFTSNNSAGNISINERGNEGKRDSYINGYSTSALGTFGINSTYWMDAGQATVQSFIQTVAKTDDALATLMTASEKAAVSSYLTGKTMTAYTGSESDNPNASGQLDAVFRWRINNILEGVETGLSALESGFTGTSEELATEAAALLTYRSALKSGGEALFGVQVTLQEIAALRQPTEATSAALTRVTNEFNATNSVAALFGKTAAEAFGSVGLASAAARENLITLSGGLDTLNTQTADFAQNYLSESERLAPVAKQVTQALADLGYAGIETRDQFKAAAQELVDSGALATEAGAKRYAGLMAIEAAFAATHEATNDTSSALEVAKKKRELEIQIMVLQGDHLGALAAKREDELAAVDSSIRGLQEMASALQSLADAQAAYDTAVQSAETALQTAAGQYQQFVTAVSTAQQGLVSAQQAIGDKYSAAMDADQKARAVVVSEQQRITAGYVAASDKVKAAQQKVAEGFYKLGADITTFIADIDGSSLSGGTVADQFAALQAKFATTLAAAQAGDSTAAGSLTTIAKSLLQTGQEASTSALEYAQLLGYVKTSLAAVADDAKNKAGDYTPATDADALKEALAEQERWASAVRASGASFVAASDDLLAGYKEAVAAQQKASIEVQFWAQIAAGTGVTVGDAAAALEKEGQALVKQYFDAQVQLATAQANLVAANEIKAGLELRQTTSLEEFVKSIKAVNSTASDVLVKGSELLAAASDKVLAGTQAALQVQQVAKDGMAYWGSVVTSSAAGIAASVQAMATAAATIAAAQQAAAVGQAAISTSYNEAMVRSWYANNEQYKSNGHPVTDSEVAFWVNALRTNDAAFVKQEFAIAAARDAGFDTPISVDKFATGGAFTNGVVSRPTTFDMGLMGEAGSEAIMPLANIGGRLGVRAVGTGQDSSELLVELRRLRAVLERNEGQLDGLGVSNTRIFGMLQRATRDGQGFIILEAS